MATSFVLFFLLYGDVEIPKLNILGNEVEFGDANKLKNILIALWLYFYVRYIVYFNDISDYGRSNDTLRRNKEHVKKLIIKKAKSKRAGFRSLDNYDYNQDTNQWSGKVVYKTSSNFLYEDIIVEGMQLKFCWFKARIGTFIKTRYFTEYTLPFIIGLIPLVILTYQHFFN